MNRQEHHDTADRLAQAAQDLLDSILEHPGDDHGNIPLPAGRIEMMREVIALAQVHATLANAH
jgi:hypothetical protein